MKPLHSVYKYVSICLMVGCTVWAGVYIFIHTDKMASFGTLSIGKISLLLGLAIFKLMVIGLFSKVILAGLGIKLDFTEWFGLSAVTAMGNYLSPFRGGIAIRALYLKNVHGLSYPLFISTFSVQYILLLSLGSFIGLIAMISLWLNFGMIYPSLTGILLLCHILPPVFLSTATRINFHYGRWTEAVNRVISGWRIISVHGNTVTTLIFLTFVNIGITLLMIHFSFVSFGQTLPMVKSLILSILFHLSTMIPLTPGGLGISELILVFTSKMLGVNSVASIFSAGLNRSAMIIASLVSGLMFTYSLSKRSADRKLLEKEIKDV